MRKVILQVMVICLLSGAAVAGNSQLLPDGVSRSASVTLHCSADGVHATPCGVVANPLVIMPVAGGATAGNQGTEITAQQSLVQSVGNGNDAAYSGSGAGTLVGILKGLLTVMNQGIPAIPVGGQPVSRSLSVPAQQSIVLFNANLARRYLAFQAPSGSGVWVNLVGGTAAPNGVDCAYFTAGSLYESGSFVNRGSITIYAPIAITISAWEG